MYNLSGAKRFFARYRVALVIFAGILAGTIYANVLVSYGKGQALVFNSGFLATFDEVSINGTYLWQYVCKTRLKDFALILIIGHTKIGKVAFNVYLAYIGISAGALISFAVMHYNVAGVLIYFVSVMPQYIFYGISLWFIMKMIYNTEIRTQNKIVIVIIAIMLLIAGTYMEAYVNPEMLKKLYVFMY